jgi:hypothetical protein
MRGDLGLEGCAGAAGPARPGFSTGGRKENYIGVFTYS